MNGRRLTDTAERKAEGSLWRRGRGGGIVAEEKTSTRCGGASFRVGSNWNFFLIVANRGEEGNEKNSAKWFVRSDIMGNVCIDF